MNFSIGYTNFESDVLTLAKKPGFASSPKRAETEKAKFRWQSNLRKKIFEKFRIRKGAEFEYYPQVLDFKDKMAQVRAERQEIQRRMAELEKRIDNRRKAREIRNEGIVGICQDSPMKLALKQKHIIQRRLERKRRNTPNLFLN